MNTSGLDGELQILLNVLIATALGAIIGIEREWADKPAGLRTQMFVAGAAALLASLGFAVFAEVTTQKNRGYVNADPIRVIEAIVTGVSFLGAGTIFRRGLERNQVEGLTTAASLLFTAGIGIATALERYVLASGVAFTGLAILRGMSWIERRIGSHKGAGTTETPPVKRQS